MSRQISLQQYLVSIYWDYQNISDTKIAEYLLLFASSLGFIANRKVYSNWCEGSKAKSVLAGGNSNNPLSPHFQDQAILYSQGKFKDVWFYAGRNCQRQADLYCLPIDKGE
jgi:hypothetical protein